ncbi:hypothetical protein [Aeromonas enteropelogenes]|uniref:hypothetical protein n=1 Tax=Aeromonas enteropelogenes TaxID=29489 RepID=UPI003B9E7CFB
MSCWLDSLREQCQQRQIGDVAAELGYSRASISLALHDKYPGDTKHIQAAVERAYPSETVDCPVLGVLVRSRCHTLQDQPLGGALGGLKMQLYVSCRICPNKCDKEPES